MRPTVEVSIPLAETARTTTRHRVVVRAVAAAFLLLLSLVAGCATPSDPGLSQNDSMSSVSPAPAAVAPSGEVAAESSSAPESPPARLEIGAIGVDSDVMGLGLRPDGSMEVPAGGFPAGWYTGSPVPGQLGPSIVAGHVDWGGSPGVFYRLRELEQGDDVTVVSQDGNTVRFVVSAVEQYPKDAFPTDKVYGDIDHPGLRLITCGGQFDSDISSYDDNIVVYADRV
ncbi:MULTISPECIES: class F sortase [unclassified Rhodococcus (in: high G+C Gram-positive bacteria)]|uniref:class F sortase n=1 Tax=unclassified Rhodococcus (in: high G+C Gram-positive bacteria) TaxID=192944 RepID=UPI00211B0C9B|nr:MULTISPECIES: class F sortase [unclassified Rhodococcus (in: high G+C Gram-positive bacteria)]